jgi:hypothetical protein
MGSSILAHQMNGQATSAKPQQLLLPAGVFLLVLAGLLFLASQARGGTGDPGGADHLQQPPPGPADVLFPLESLRSSSHLTRQGSVPQSSPDSTQLRRQAQRLQGEFERRHRANLPRTRQDWAGSCDEQIGRICLRFSGGGRWEPEEENPRVAAAREFLLDSLAVIGDAIPGDHWVLGQRIRYLGDSGRWGEAEALARECREESSWWCPALRGYVLHRSGRTVDALEAFSRAFEEMDPKEAAAWWDPQVLVEYPVHRWLTNPPGLSREEALHRFWLLADPLYLTPGNERLAEHFARRFAASLYAESALTMGLSWGRPFEELLLRYGFVAGWERTFPRIGEAPDGSVVERFHPESRGLLPPAEALERPGSLGEGVWRPRDDRPRSASSPVPVPLIVEGAGQVALLRRGPNLLVVAAHGIPRDTLLTERRPRGGSLEWVDARSVQGPRPFPGPWDPMALLPDTLAGLFLVPEAGDSSPIAALGSGGEGVLQLSAPSGAYLLSLELWSPLERWGARVRQGVEMREIPPDVPSLSDLLLLRGGEALPDSLPEALPRLRPHSRLDAGQPLTVGWEIYGLGARRDPLAFRIILEEEQPGLLRRALIRTGLIRKSPLLSLSWEEGSPGQPGPLFRAVDLELPDLRPGDYVLRLELDIPFRSRVSSERRLAVSPRTSPISSR